MYESRQSFDGPKKLLSLDGGGLRGMLSLRVLSEIERQLREYRARPDLVLADEIRLHRRHSTGAIIAASLSLGFSVERIEQLYRRLAQSCSSNGRCTDASGRCTTGVR
ncbi:MAG: hypothetical protein R2705_21240 [Ilumatobacteraceae bacterium]